MTDHAKRVREFFYDARVVKYGTNFGILGNNRSSNPFVLGIAATKQGAWTKAWHNIVEAIGAKPSDYRQEMLNAHPNLRAEERSRHHHSIITAHGVELGFGGTEAHAWYRAWRHTFPYRAHVLDKWEEIRRETERETFVEAITHQGQAGNPDFDAMFEALTERNPDAMTYRHCMIDLETWSTEPNALIISIGAVKFNLDEPIREANPKFHIGIEPTDALMKQFHVSASTLAFWMAPEREPALRAWQAMEKTDMASALYAFQAWLWDGQHDEVPAIWGNGAAFDNVVLRNAYESFPMLSAPWSYSLDRCYRTMKNLNVTSTLSDEAVAHFVPGEGKLEHAALFDAVKQAMHLQLIYAVLGR